MTWRASDAMSERVKFIGLLRSGERTLSGLCREFGISRPTGYKWAERFEEEGAEGLKERSRAPAHRPQETSAEVQEVLVQARRRHPSWGPRKLKAWLEERPGTPELPAASTIGDILQRAGLVKPRRLRRQLPLPVGPYTPQVSRPNEEWAADFKGQFLMGCGTYCYPLTISDGFSRYLLEIRALRDTCAGGARKGFERAFRTYGLPEAIRTDNGSPFASIALGRLSSLSIWWLKLGIRPVTIRPSHPQDNGRHERMHRTLKAEATRPPAKDLGPQQKRFLAFQREYNQERPHEALGQRSPARIYRPSQKTYPKQIPSVEYPSHYEVRQVSTGGIFTWRGKNTFISQSLVGERIGLTEFDDGLWRVYFANLELGILDEVQVRESNTGRVLPMSPNAKV